ncbi:MAG: hypothetical protein KF745_02145 [Phycisphaeraceae bacterium]|nr:hypothetical protein [Phycisphaeraceae bacterium]
MTRMVRGNFQIGSNTGVCAATGSALGPGDRFVAVLLEHDETEELVRVDYSADAWDSGARPPRPDLVFATWRAVVAAPDAKRRVLVDDAALVDLFEQLADTTEPRRLAFRYVLALILIRKRLLVCEATRGSTMLVRPKGPRDEGTPAATEVIDPGLDDATILDVTEQLTAVMAGSGETGTPGPESPGNAAP